MFLPFLEVSNTTLLEVLSSSALLGRRQCFAVMHVPRYDLALCSRPLLFVFEKKDAEFQFHVIDVSRSDVAQPRDDGVDVDEMSLGRYLESGVECFSLSAPWYLQPCAIKKPWGQEIWYSAMEARGVCRFAISAQSSAQVGSQSSSKTSSQSSRSDTPIPWILELGSTILGGADKLNLLKILAPHNHPNFGELYFELHQHKQEVYVVSHIDKTAWPSGVGQMRFGFCSTKLAQYQSFDDFKVDYLRAAEQYSQHRTEIDTLLADKGMSEIGAAEEILSLESKIKLRAELPQELLLKEESLYRDLNEFVGFRELSLGDVVRVPKNFPHSLMHGVRVVEFQTPVYERMILSFNQKVLTQEHWDTKAALDLLAEAPEALEQVAQVEALPGASIQTIVEFEDFTVKRLSFNEAASVCWGALGLNVDAYALVMSLGGSVTLLAPQSTCLEKPRPQWQLGPEQSVFLRPGLAVDFTAAAGDVVLICQPNLR